jgi:hypothetical protein
MIGCDDEFHVHSFGVRGQRSEIRDQGSGIRKNLNDEFVVSHPFAEKMANGWGTELGC